MFTRYNSPAEYKPANTYVPIPFEELLTAGMMRDKQYNENESASDQFYAGMKDINVHAADQDLYQEKIGELDKQMQETLKNNPDVGSYEFKRNLDQIISAQSREPAWRQMKYNLVKATELEKAYDKAKSEGNTPANLAEIEDQLQRFYKEGSKGVGFLKDASPYKFIDYAKPLEERGQGFLKEGNYTGMYDQNFNLKTTSSREGVPVQEVAAVYGYGIDRKTGGLKFMGIPTDFLMSDAGNQLQRDARYISKTSGEPFEKILNALYQQKAAPLVSKYSGVTTKYDQDLSSVGSNRLLEPQVTNATVYSTPSKPLGDNRTIEGKVSNWEPTTGGKLLRALTAGAVGVYDTKRAKEITADLFGDNAKKNEDFKAIERNILAVNPGLKGDPKALQNAVEDHFENFYDQGKQMPVGLVIAPKEKDRMAKIFFGSNADQGTVTGETLSGAGLNQKLVDPADPKGEKTISEIAGKSSTIGYVGPLKNNNLYGPGYHEVVIDGKTYYMKGTEQEKNQNHLEWSMYDYERHASGIGDWFTTPDAPNKEIRSVKFKDKNGNDVVKFEVKGKKASNDSAVTIGVTQPNEESVIDSYFNVIQPALKK
jgi:hypothetical protein